MFHPSLSTSGTAPLGARVKRPNLPTALARPIGSLRSDPHQPAVAVRCVSSWQRALVSETTHVISFCICSNAASVIRSIECSFSICCRHTRPVYKGDRGRRWRMMALLSLVLLYLFSARMHKMCLFTSSDMNTGAMKRRTTHSVFLYVRQVHILNIVVWKDGRAQPHILGGVLFEIDQ